MAKKTGTNVAATSKPQPGRASRGSRGSSAEAISRREDSDDLVGAPVHYVTASNGIDNAESIGESLSEIYKVVGSGRVQMDPARQAGIMLNAIGKRMGLESLRLRGYAKAQSVSGKFFQPSKELTDQKTPETASTQ